MAQTLYIIGNGFDIHHGMNTNYVNFKTYLDKNHPELIRKMDKFYDIDFIPKFWNKFERSLKYFNPEELENNYCNYLPDIISDDYRDGDWDNLRIYILEELDLLRVELQQAFNNWIESQLPPKDIDSRKITIQVDAKYLSFNYTDILETVYHISRDKILYIHNRVKEGKDLLYGHAWDPSEWVEAREPKMPDGLTPNQQQEWIDNRNDQYHYSIYLGKLEINEFFTSLYKDCSKNIELHKTFFADLKDVKKIYILGHSCSDVDIDYYREIVQNITVQTVDWFVSDYNGDYELKKDALVNIGIPDDRIKIIYMTKM